MELTFLLGVIIAVLGLVGSIALHEAGHLVPAKAFGVAAPEFSVGLGPKLYTKRLGATTYVLRALPFGGYVKIGGMFPPPSPRANPHGLSAKFWAVQQRREAGWTGKGLWQLRTWQQVVIMLAGPVVNLVLGATLLLVAFSAIGTPTYYNALETVRPGSPAATAGLRAGDEITAVNGTTTDDWGEVVAAVQDAGTAALVIDYVRDGRTATTEVVTAAGEPLGVQGAFGHERLPLAQVPNEVAEMVAETGRAVAAFPEKIAELAVTTTTDAPRATDSPVSMVGIGGLYGEIAAADIFTTSTKAYLLLLVLGSVNLSLFFINLAPLPPLDGGRIVTSVASSLRRRVAALRRRADPGQLSPAVLMPVTYSVMGVYLLVGLLVVSADFIEPIRFTN